MDKGNLDILTIDIMKIANLWESTFWSYFSNLLLQLPNQVKLQWILLLILSVFNDYDDNDDDYNEKNLVSVCWGRRSAGGEQVEGGGHIPWDHRDDNGGCGFEKKKQQEGASIQYSIQN